MIPVASSLSDMDSDLKTKQKINKRDILWLPKEDNKFHVNAIIPLRMRPRHYFLFSEGSKSLLDCKEIKSVNPKGNQS